MTNERRKEIASYRAKMRETANRYWMARMPEMPADEPTDAELADADYLIAMQDDYS